LRGDRGAAVQEAKCKGNRSPETMLKMESIQRLLAKRLAQLPKSLSESIQDEKRDSRISVLSEASTIEFNFEEADDESVDKHINYVEDFLDVNDGEWDEELSRLALRLFDQLEKLQTISSENARATQKVQAADNCNSLAKMKIQSAKHSEVEESAVDEEFLQSKRDIKMKYKEAEKVLELAYLQQKSAIKSQREKDLDDALKMEKCGSIINADAIKSLNSNYVALDVVKVTVREIALGVEKVAKAETHENCKDMATRNELQTQYFRDLFNFLTRKGFAHALKDSEVQDYFSTDADGRDIIESIKHKLLAQNEIVLSEMITRAQVMSPDQIYFAALSTIICIMILLFVQ
jgi:hypothetical protein